MLLAVAMPLAALTGYTQMAQYLSRSAMQIAILVGGLFLIRTMLREGLSTTLQGRHRFGRYVRDGLVLREETERRLGFWLGGALDLLVVLFGLPLILGILQLGADETTVWVGKLLRGVQVGSFTVSVLDLVTAFAIFILVMVVTRLIQRGLDRHVLPNVSSDPGVRDALRSGVGYFGFLIAILITVASLGIDLQNIAIVAGALSVGIGFGLQNVFNNFVSGLILLVERPIKPGDWVIVGSYEGTVKKVNVRSTEIETFQRASVIIPNADLISNSVTNWTHKNLSGRVEVGGWRGLRQRCGQGAGGAAGLRPRPSQRGAPSAALCVVPEFRRQLARFRGAGLSRQRGEQALHRLGPAFRHQQAVRRGRDRNPVPAAGWCTCRLRPGRRGRRRRLGTGRTRKKAGEKPRLFPPRPAADGSACSTRTTGRRRSPPPPPDRPTTAPWRRTP